MKENKNIVLIGMMGCGKSTLAKHLGIVMNKKVIEMDDYVQEKFQMTIDEMFAKGEDYFRNCETSCYDDIKDFQGVIISCGGGAILREENLAYLKNNSIIFYLDRPIDLILNDIDVSQRPLLKKGKERLYVLYEQRHALYLKACDVHVINSGTVEQTCDEVMKSYNERSL